MTPDDAYSMILWMEWRSATGTMREIQIASNSSHHAVWYHAQQTSSWGIQSNVLLGRLYDLLHAAQLGLQGTLNLYKQC